MKNTLRRSWMLALILSLAASANAALPTISIIAHRGEHLHHPQNTIPAFQAAIDKGAHFIELDVRTTSDGRLVLMHNGAVDGTTNGTGLVSALTFDQIRALDAGAKFAAEFKGTRVPTFEEALELAHGRIDIYVDVKQASPQALLDAIRKYDMEDHVVIYDGIGGLREMRRLAPSIKVMPEADSPEDLDKIFKELHPRVVAFSDRDFTKEAVEIAKKAGADVYVDRLGADADTPEKWEAAIQMGATGIQTDHPAELFEYLKKTRWRLY